MTSQIPTCRLAVYLRVGHGINILHPQWCVQQIREFLGLPAKG
jgi:hypothetical protein